MQLVFNDKKFGQNLTINIYIYIQLLLLLFFYFGLIEMKTEIWS